MSFKEERQPDPGSSEPAFVVAFTTKNGKQKMREKNGSSSFQAAGRNSDYRKYGASSTIQYPNLEPR